jgi:cytochrome b
MLIWDIPTRVFHWMLAVCIVISFVSVNQDWMELHFASGSVILALILFRLIWGLIGSKTALLWQFFPTPARIRAWRAGEAIGHSPIASLSVFAMLGLIGAQATLGLFTDDDIYLTGPLRDYVSSSFARDATNLHAQGAQLIFALVILHLVAIAFYTLIKRSDLLRVFLTGKRPEGAMGIVARPFVWALGAALVAALPVIWIFQFA